MLVCCLPDDDADSPATRFELTRLTVITRGNDLAGN